MRIHLSQQALKFLRSLGEQGAELRQAVESLKQNPTPDWAITLTGNHYEFFTAGYWLLYEIDSTTSETIVRITAIQDQ